MKLILLAMLCVGCFDASDSLNASQKLMSATGALDASGTTGCLAECMKYTTESLKAADAGQLSRSSDLYQKSMACTSRCEQGGGRAAAKATGVGNNKTGCLAKCMEYTTKAMKLIEAGDLSGSTAMTQKSYACTDRCEQGGGRAAAKATGVGNNTTGCVLKCLEDNPKGLKLAEAGDFSGSAAISEKAMACTHRCEGFE